MALPKIESTLFKVTIPSNGIEIKMRPMTIREEKVLLAAKQGEEESDILDAMIQIVNNCMVDDKISAENLCYFDIEWLFLKLRANSVSNIVKLTYIDSEDGDKEHEFSVDLDKVKPPTVTNPGKVDLGNGIALQLKYPSAKLYSSAEYNEADEQGKFGLVLRSAVDKIWEGDKMHEAKNASTDELEEFINSIPSKQFEEINTFFSEQPSMFYEIKYKDSKKEEKKISLTSLVDFFTF